MAASRARLAAFFHVPTDADRSARCVRSDVGTVY